MLTRLKRLWLHRRLDERDVQRLLPSDALTRIQQQVAHSELGHGGQIRVCIEAGLPWSYLAKQLRARDRAIMLFSKLRVWDTAANNGVLIYLLLAERAIEIVADRGLVRRVPAAEFEALVAAMREAFRAGRFEPGLLTTVDRLDALLRQHFPLAEGEANPNELPDAPTVL